MPIVYMNWAVFGKSMGAIDANQQKYYFQKALELGPADSYVLSQLSDLVSSTDKTEAIDHSRIS